MLHTLLYSIYVNTSGVVTTFSSVIFPPCLDQTAEAKLFKFVAKKNCSRASVLVSCFKKKK